jgi:hypothetical protein
MTPAINTGEKLVSRLEFFVLKQKSTITHPRGDSLDAMIKKKLLPLNGFEPRSSSPYSM